MARTFITLTIIFLSMLNFVAAQTHDSVLSVSAPQILEDSIQNNDTIRVIVYSDPINATLYVNGYFKGTTPIGIFLSPGLHQFYLRSSDDKSLLITTERITGKQSFFFTLIERDIFTLKELDRSKTYGKLEGKATWYLGMGPLYKIGYFNGELADNFSSYTTVRPFFYFLMRNDIYFDIGYSLFGTFQKMNQAMFLTQSVEGEYYGKHWEFHTALGYRLLENEIISLITVASLSVLSYDIYAHQTYVFTPMYYMSSTGYSKVNNGRYKITGLGPGIIGDYNFGESKRGGTKLILRLRYNAFLYASDNQFQINGIIHEFNAGILMVLKINNK
jgi:hypothetical protein